MKARLAGFSVLLGASTVALAQVRLPVSAPTLSEWGLIGLGLIVAMAAGISIRRRK